MTGALCSLDLTAFGYVVLIESELFTVLICFVYPCYVGSLVHPKPLEVGCWIELVQSGLWLVFVIKLKCLYISDLVTFSFLAIGVCPLMNCILDFVVWACCQGFVVSRSNCHHPKERSYGLKELQGRLLCCLSLVAWVFTHELPCLGHQLLHLTHRQIYEFDCNLRDLEQTWCH